MAEGVGAGTDGITLTSGVRSLLPFARPARGPFLLSGALAAASALVGLVPFWAIYRVVAEVVEGRPEQSELRGLAAVALVGVLARFVLLGLSTFVSHVAAYRVLHGIRMGLAEHLTRVPLGQVVRRRSGELKKVMGDDVERLEQFLAHAIPDVTAAALTLVAAGTWLVVVDWRMGLGALVLVVPAFAAMGAAMRRSSRHMTEYQSSLAEMNASIVELVRGMPVVKVFNRADDEVRQAERAIDHHVAVVRRYSLDFLPFGTAFFVLVAANVAVIVPLGVWLWERGSLATSDLLFFFIVGLGVLQPVLALLSFFTNLSHLSSGGNLVAELLAVEVQPEGRSRAEPGASGVRFDGVGFAYGERRVLHDITFEARPGTVTALVGPSGSGKSTIASLVARFADADEGVVAVAGVDVRDLSADALGAQVAVVLQDTFLFDDTVAGNLRVARADASDAELEAACRAARIHDVVTGLPRGYATTVGERGARLSGGERQRLTIARAMLADAPVVVLDEATAFADPENEAAIQDAIGELVEGRTVLMIAHRLSSVVGAAQILVVDEGRIVERGRHDELVAKGGLYSRLWDDFQVAEQTGLGAAASGGPA